MYMHIFSEIKLNLLVISDQGLLIMNFGLALCNPSCPVIFLVYGCTFTATVEC